tara:strand:- start:160 stop:354 length:195 start_codon:yes stop_codon:yes gene_type:complete
MTLKKEMEEIINLHIKQIKRYEKELKNSRLKFAHVGIRLNLWRMKRSLKHYQFKLNKYRNDGYV